MRGFADDQVFVSPCFNEAEARAPRMLDAGRYNKALIAKASMRPRRARLGCDLCLTKALRYHCALQ
jgi:hypothetical protein